MLFTSAGNLYQLDLSIAESISSCAIVILPPNSQVTKRKKNAPNTWMERMAKSIGLPKFCDWNNDVMSIMEQCIKKLRFDTDYFDLDHQQNGANYHNVYWEDSGNDNFK